MDAVTLRNDYSRITAILTIVNSKMNNTKVNEKTIKWSDMKIIDYRTRMNFLATCGWQMIGKLWAWISGTQITACGWQVMSIWVRFIETWDTWKKRREFDEFEKMSSGWGNVYREQFDNYMKIYNDELY